MPGFTLSARCYAPVEEVWKLLFDPARFPDWWVGIETVRKDSPDEFTQWPTGYPDFPMPQKLRVDQANERVTISCQVSDIDVVWQLAEAGMGTSITVTSACPSTKPAGSTGSARPSRNRCAASPHSLRPHSDQPIPHALRLRQRTPAVFPPTRVTMTAAAW
jgi:hypothetical protein